MASAAALLPLPVLFAGCFIVTGSTDGYQRSASSLALDAGAEAGEAGPGLTLGCLSATDCAGGDGAAPICCFALTSTTSAATACAPSPCNGQLAVQLCESSAECALDAGGCTPQACTFGSASVTIRACGLVSVGCTALP